MEWLASALQERSCVWVSNSTQKEGREHRFERESTIDAIKAHLDSIPRTDWIDLVLGARHSKDGYPNLPADDRGCSRGGETRVRDVRTRV